MKLSVFLPVLSRHAASVILAASLVACSTTTGQPRGGDAFKQQVGAVYQARGSGGEMYVVTIPSANNALSNALIVASSKLSADSNAVKAIHAMLASPKVEDLAVVGLSPGVNVAEAKAAVASARSVAGRKRVYVFAGDHEPGTFESPQPDVEVYWVRADGTLR